MNSNLLIKVADVLDALAAKTDQQANELESIKAAARNEKIEPMLDKLAFITGQSVEEIQEKLAHADSDILDLLTKLSGTDGAAVQLGGPDTTKTASNSGNPDTAFADWVLS